VIGGIGLSFSPIDPKKALVLSAVINGVAAAPIMAVTMFVVMRKDVMGVFVATPLQRIFGLLASAAMAVAAAGMLVLMA
jgi:Mn2+/Fe2+ NRAMP family transporter